MKGMMTCKVCGRDFALIAEDHYIAMSKGNGITLGEWTSLGNEDRLFDVIDCPHCGCQTVLQERKKTCDDDKGSYVNFNSRVIYENCHNCKYANVNAGMDPCRICCRRYLDKFEMEGEDE